MIMTKYKQTDVGTIPEDWDVVTLRQLGIFSKGKGISRADSNSGKIPAIRYGEIYTVHHDYIKEFHSFISEEVAISSKKLNYGDILFTASGETKEDIAKAVAYIAKDQEAYAGGDIIILSPTCEVDSMYLGYVLNTKEVIRQRMSKAQGDAVVHITTDAVSSIQIPLPPLKEQKAIAKALSDVDCLIECIATLIAKKRNIKQATMQQLLTGKTRLSGFSGRWVEYEIGNFVPKKGEQINKSALSSNVYGYPVMNGGIQPSGYFSQYNTNANSVIISEGGNSCGYVNYMKTHFWAGGHCYVLTNLEGMDVNYIYQTLKYNEPQIMGLRSGSGLPNIKKSTLSEHKIYITTSLSEQQAISRVFHDMDENIASLEQQKAKYESIREGMMQELLTGKIRLV